MASSDGNDIKWWASECRRSLESCASLEPLSHEQWAPSRLIDFNLWAGGIGVFAKGKHALHERLLRSPHPKTADVISANLDVLHSALKQCIQIGGFGVERQDEIACVSN